MGKSWLSFGGAKTCTDLQKADFSAGLKGVVDVIRKAWPTDSWDFDDLRSALEKFDTLSVRFTSPKPPGFFERIEPSCFLTGSEFSDWVKTLKLSGAGSSSSSFKGVPVGFPGAMRAGGLGGLVPADSFAGSPAGSPAALKNFLDNVGITKSEVKPDWVRIGLLGGNLLLLILLIFVLVYRGREAPSYYGYGSG